MLITIHNLPACIRYSDIKALLQSMCDLTEGFVLDNLVAEGANKKVTVGLADADDAAVVTRKLNGFQYNGQRLSVEDLRKSKPKTMEQPYQTSSGNINMSNNMPPVNQSMNQMMMSTPYYNLPTQSPYYCMPQTNFMGYSTQPQQSMYQPSAMQLPNQGYNTQAPLGFRSEGGYSTQSWSQNQQTNEENYSQDSSKRKPEKRSFDDRSGNSYSEDNKRSKWDDSKEDRPRKENRGWQSQNRDGGNWGRFNNSNDYFGVNDDQSADNAQSSWSNEPRRGYDKYDEYNKDTGSYDRSDYYNDRSGGDDYGYDDRDQGYGRKNDNKMKRNNSERSNSNNAIAKDFNKYHWPPLKTDSSREPAGRSSEFYGGQNSNPKTRVWENSSRGYNQPSGFEYQGSNFKDAKRGKKAPKEASNAMLSSAADTWRGQAASCLVKEVLYNVHVTVKDNNPIRKRLKEAIRRTVDNLLKGMEVPYEEILLRYRAKFLPQNDYLLYNKILNRLQNEGSSLDVPFANTFVPNRRRVKFVPGPEDGTWVEAKNDNGYVKDPQPFKKKLASVQKPSKKARKKFSRKTLKKLVYLEKMQRKNPNYPILPSYPKGNKNLFKQIKKKEKEDLAGETEFNLEPLLEKAVEEELDKIADFIRTQKLTHHRYNRIFQMIPKSTIPEELKKAVKIQLCKRILNMGPVGVRISGSPKLPKRAKLAEFLVQYKLLSLKASKRYPMYVAECPDYPTAYKLIENVNNTVFEGMTLQVKYLHLVEPQPKMKSADIMKFRHDFIQRQIDDSTINILEYNDGKPYGYPGTDVTALDDGDVEMAEDHGESEKGDTIIKEEKNAVDTTTAQAASVKLENVKEDIVKNNVKDEPDVEEKKKPLLDTKEVRSNESKDPETVKKCDVDNTIDITGNDNADDENEEVSIVDLNEIDDDDLEDY